jgi:hypothetical protein
MFLVHLPLPEIGSTKVRKKEDFNTAMLVILGKSNIFY